MIGPHNMIAIATTLPHNTIAEKRRVNLVNEFSSYGIPLLLDCGIQGQDVVKIMYQIMVNKLERAKQLNVPYVLICDDDFSPIPNFLEELNRSVACLPSNWRTLHLCPGYLWGKLKQNSETRLPRRLGELDPDGSLEGMESDPKGRVFVNCTNRLLHYRGIWMGTPIAFVVRREEVDSLLKAFQEAFEKLPVNNDVLLSLIFEPNDYICRNPVLGYERDEGASLFGPGGTGLMPGYLEEVNTTT